jgi:hypothetical protein
MNEDAAATAAQGTAAAADGDAQKATSDCHSICNSNRVKKKKNVNHGMVE